MPTIKQCQKILALQDFTNIILTFTDIVVKDAENDTTGLKFLKYSIAASKLFITFDGHTTFKSGFHKIKEQFTPEIKSCLK